jgi:hypothetical protein
MARYQIRTPENMTINDVIFAMNARAREVLQAWNFFESSPSGDDWDHLSSTIRGYLDLYVKNYKLCGISSICLDHVKSTPWSPDSHALDATPQDMIYQLLPRTELDDFLKELTTRFYHALMPLLKANHEEEVVSIVQAVFQNVLAGYLYYNPLCGFTELCTYSALAYNSPVWHRREREN